MKYQVLYQANAAKEIDLAFTWSFDNYPRDAATKWCSKLLEAIESLQTNPERCPVARENLHFEETIRQLVFGQGKSRYRILFTIDQDAVRVLHIRFPGQPLLAG